MAFPTKEEIILLVPSSEVCPKLFNRFVYSSDEKIVSGVRTPAETKLMRLFLSDLKSEELKASVKEVDFISAIS